MAGVYPRSCGMSGAGSFMKILGWYNPHMQQDASRTELLLELIVNELLRFRIQVGPEVVEGHVVPPEGYAVAFAERLDQEIISLRQRLGMPVSPFSTLRSH